VGGREPSSSVGALGIELFIVFCQTGEGGVLLQQTEPGQLAFTHHLCPAPVYIVGQPAISPSGGTVNIRLYALQLYVTCYQTERIAIDNFHGNH